jgi:hypothetical protein
MDGPYWPPLGCSVVPKRTSSTAASGAMTQSLLAELQADCRDVSSARLQNFSTRRKMPAERCSLYQLEVRRGD